MDGADGAAADTHEETQKEAKAKQDAIQNLVFMIFLYLHIEINIYKQPFIACLLTAEPQHFLQYEYLLAD